MTNKLGFEEKIQLIDEYLAEGNIDIRWRAMIWEYRELLVNIERKIRGVSRE